MSRILVIEDEPNLAQGLIFNLEGAGYAAHSVGTADEALPIFADYDLLILDVMLPGMSGVELLRRIRKIDHKKPVLVLSAKSSDDDLATGLLAGADDYVTKPFSLVELLLRVKRMLERHSWIKEEVSQLRRLELGPYWVDFATLEASTTQGLVGLTPYECYLLKYLVEHSDRAVTREELLRQVWGYEHTPETRTVDIFIGRLRKLFEEDSRNPRHIISLRGVGYRFTK